MSKAKVSEEDRRQFWNMAIDTWQASDLSIRQFCKQEGLSEPQFYLWRKKLAGSSPKPVDQDKAGQPAFIEGIHTAKVSTRPSSATSEGWRVQRVKVPQG